VVEVNETKGKRWRFGGKHAVLLFGERKVSLGFGKENELEQKASTREYIE